MSQSPCIGGPDPTCQGGVGAVSFLAVRVLLDMPAARRASGPSSLEAKLEVRPGRAACEAAAAKDVGRSGLLLGQVPLLPELDALVVDHGPRPSGSTGTDVIIVFGTTRRILLMGG